MLCVSFTDDDAREEITSVEDVRRAQTRLPRLEVRAALAAEIGVKPGTIENIRRGRYDSLRTAVRDRIYGWMLRGHLQTIAGLDHDLFVAIQSGAGPASDEILGAKTAIAQAKITLNEILRQQQRGRS